MTVEIRLLGPAEVRIDGRPVTIAGRQTRAALAALALRHPRPVAADELAELLWAVGRPHRWEASLYAHVSRLRKALGTEVVGRVPAGYRLTRGDAGPDGVTVDVAAFAADVAAARAAVGRGEPGVAADGYGRALARWRGPALRELEDFPFADEEGRRLARTRIAVLEEQADVLVQVGRFEEAVAALATLLADDPLHEPGWALQVTALARSGRRARALEVYDEAVAVLSREMGVVPGAEIEAAREAIDDAAAGGPVRPGPAAVAVRPEVTAVVGDLSPVDRWLLSLLLVAGPTADPTVVAVAGDVGLAELFDTIGRARTAGLLLAGEAGSPEGTTAASGVVADLLASLSGTELSLVHRRLAEAAAASPRPAATGAAQARWALGAVAAGHPVAAAVATCARAIVDAVHDGDVAEADALAVLLQRTVAPDHTG